MTQTSKRPLLTVLTASVAAVAALAGGMTASAAEPSPTAGIAQPDLVALLRDYEHYYQPAEDYNKADPSSFGKGTVTDLGKTVLAWNDRTTQNINNTAAAGSDGTTPTAQQQRALVDSDYNFEETFPDALGPVLGGYLSEGLKASANADGSVNPNGPLAKTYRLLENDTANTASGSYANSLVSDWVDTSAAKTHFNHPRPYVDRTNGGYPAAGLATTLDIRRVPAWNGHDANYDGMVTSGSFPSGHTTYAYSGGIGLATLLPELGPEIMTRASEAGNNRIVLGVHYSLDIMGGRIDGEVANTALWSDPTFRTDYLMPARQELTDYLTGQCRAHGQGDTLEACITAVGANGSNGYTNSFTDGIVNTKPVTDRASAIDAYTARMTYGFQPTGATGQPAVVPQGASNLLLTAFPELTDAQRTQVLAASEIDSGYPLDASSDGYQRLNLARAYSANVTLSADKSTITKITFGNAAPAVTVASSGQQPGGQGQTGTPGQSGQPGGTSGQQGTPSTQPGSTTKPGTEPATKPGATPGATNANGTSGTTAGTTGALSKTGAAVLGVAVAAVLATGAGVTLMLIRRRDECAQ